MSLAIEIVSSFAKSHNMFCWAPITLKLYDLRSQNSSERMPFFSFPSKKHFSTLICDSHRSILLYGVYACPILINVFTAKMKLLVNHETV